MFQEGSDVGVGGGALLKETGEHRGLRLNLDGFAWEAIRDAAEEEGVTVEEMVTFSVLYYLADCDSGRIARCTRCGPYPEVR